MNKVTFGIDFGTTNTVVMRAAGNERPSIVHLDGVKSGSATHPSILAFELEQTGRSKNILCETGHRAIDIASKFPEDVRYIQSFKNYAASRSFNKTRVFGKEFSFPDILSAFFKNTDLVDVLRSEPAEKRLVIGRPVKFHGASPDDPLAMQRYRDAFNRLGVKDITFVFEPIGGAFAFLRRLNSSATVLVADFGGGTSDFSIVRFEIGESGASVVPLAHFGIGVAGDTFDYRIIENALFKHLGKNTTYLSSNKELRIPNRYFSSFANWHHLTMLRTQKHLRELKDMQRTAREPELVQNLVDVIEMNRGLTCFSSVSKTKARLSTEKSATLSIDLKNSSVQENISRRDFEFWIQNDLSAIAETVDSVLDQADLEPSQIDRIFLTGGSSLIPAVRGIFESRFKTNQVEFGNEFSSVAEGLALVGLENNLDQWSV